jgi:hypothetical protein
VKGKGRPKIDKSNRFEDYNKLNGSKSCWKMHENTICYNLDSSNCKGGGWELSPKLSSRVISGFEQV